MTKHATYVLAFRVVGVYLFLRVVPNTIVPIAMVFSDFSAGGLLENIAMVGAGFLGLVILAVGCGLMVVKAERMASFFSDANEPASPGPYSQTALLGLSFAVSQMVSGILLMKVRSFLVRHWEKIPLTLDPSPGGRGDF